MPIQRETPSSNLVRQLNTTALTLVKLFFQIFFLYPPPQKKEILLSFYLANITIDVVIFIHRNNTHRFISALQNILKKK